MTRKHVVQGVGAIALIVVGVVAGVTWTERHGRGQPAGGGTIPAGSAGVQAGREGAKSGEIVEITLTREAGEPAGVKTTAARSAGAGASLSGPGAGMSDARSEERRGGEGGRSRW